MRGSAPIERTRSAPQPILDEAPRDRVAARQAKTVVVPVAEKEAALEPARVFEFPAVDVDLGRARPAWKPTMSEAGNGQGCDE